MPKRQRHFYDRFTALDAVGPYEVLSRLPGATTTFVATERGPKTTDTGRLTIVADASIDELPNPDVVACGPSALGLRQRSGGAGQRPAPPSCSDWAETSLRSTWLAAHPGP